MGRPSREWEPKRPKAGRPKDSENVKPLGTVRAETRMLVRDGIPRLEFSSSNLVAAELEPGGVVLVEFSNGAQYRYGGFTEALFTEWGEAPSAGSWFHRVIKRNPKKHPPNPMPNVGIAEPNVGTHVTTVVPVHVETAQPHVLSTETVRPDEVLTGRAECPHTLMRELAGGTCPVCPQISVDVRSSVPVVFSPAEGTPKKSGAETKACDDGSHPSPPTTVRPPIEQAPLDSIGVAHGPAPVPEYMRKPLRTLTRAEATALLTKLQARRMRARLSTFIRGASGTGADGAWHVLEDGELDWNWHHDALCDHTQLMLEELYLAGLKPAAIGMTLDRWHGDAQIDVAIAASQSADEQGRARARVEQIDAMRAHWLRPTTEFYTIPTTPTPTYIYGCGGGKYIQRTNDLAINVGPISLKSRIVMVFAIAWMWLRVPGWEVFCGSGTPSNVSRDSLATRDLVTDRWYRDTFAIEWTIRLDLNRIDKWGTTAGGTREARGTATNVTGIHADGLLLDDPDDAKGVWSDADRKAVMLFWKALGNRLKDPTRPCRVLVQQNLHEEDLTTRTVTDGMPRLAIPVEFQTADRDKLCSAPFGWVDPRGADGELLQASRFTAKYLAGERTRLGTHGFEAQYNCNPRPIGGGMIKSSWYRFFRIEDPSEDERTDPRPRPTGCVGSGGEYGTVAMHPAFVLKRKHKVRPNELAGKNDGQVVSLLQLDWLTLSVDATFGSLKDTASAVALCVFGGQAQRRFVFDDSTEPRTFTDTKRAIASMVRKWGPKRILIEKKANGAPVLEELEIWLAEGRLLGPDGKPITVVLEAIEVPGGKESRAAAMVPSIEAGLWYLLEGAHWVPAYVGELTSFPTAKRDDRVDSTSQLAAYYREPDVLSKWRKFAGK